MRGNVLLDSNIIRQQKKMKLPDAIIAATALEKRCVLVTRDRDDFKNIDQELHIIDPFSPAP